MTLRQFAPVHSRRFLLLLGLCWWSVCAQAQDNNAMHDVARNVVAGESYLSAREAVLSAGWKPDPIAADGRGDCGDLAKFCQEFPESGNCWQDGRTFCSMEFVDPEGNSLMIRIQIDSRGNPVVFDRQFFSEEGAG